MWNIGSKKRQVEDREWEATLSACHKVFPTQGLEQSLRFSHLK